MSRVAALSVLALAVAGPARAAEPCVEVRGSEPRRTETVEDLAARGLGLAPASGARLTAPRRA